MFARNITWARPTASHGGRGSERLLSWGIAGRGTPRRETQRGGVLEASQRQFRAIQK